MVLVLDSGASDHMVKDERLFVMVQKLNVSIRRAVAKEDRKEKPPRKERMRQMVTEFSLRTAVLP